MKLSFKMKVRLSVGVAFLFIIALIIHEDHAGVVLKKFKPRRLIAAELQSKEAENNSSILTKTPSKSQEKSQKKTPISKEVPIIRNSTDTKNETVAKGEILLSSSVVYQTANDAVLKTPRTIPNLSKNLSVEKDVKKDSNGIKVPKENSSGGVFQELDTAIHDHISDKIPKHQTLDTKETVSDVKISSLLDPIVNKTESVTPQQPNENFQRSLDFEAIQDNHTGVNLSISNSSDSMLSGVDSIKKETLIKDSSNNPKENFLLDEQPAKQIEVDKDKQKAETVSHFPISSISEQLNDKMSISHQLNLSSVPLMEKLVDQINEVVVDNTEIPLVNETDEKSMQEILLSHQNSDQNMTPVTNSMSPNAGPTESNILSTNETNQIGFESIVSAGFDFLANSEVAKNAAIAMEIFNLSDSSLTDHIIDDPDDIDLIRPSLSTQDDLPDTSSSSKIEQDILPNKVNESSVDDKLAESGNTGAVSTSTETVSDLLPIVSSNDTKKCPPPGICVFWFMARNTCNSDDQCVGSKICCRIRCSKQCIDV